MGQRSMVTVLGVAAAMLLASPAHALLDDGFSLGVGTGVGIHHAGGADAAPTAGLVGDINLRGRFLWLLGLDWRYHMQPDAAVALGDGPQYAAKYRTTALLYPVSTDVVSVYLGAGIGAVEFHELLLAGAEGSSYHAGLGLEWALSRHLTFDASFYLLVPGYKSVARDVERRGALEVAAYQADPSGRPPEVGAPSVGDYVSLDNFELAMRVMVVF